jgi:micrococcal nuclease
MLALAAAVFACLTPQAIDGDTLRCGGRPVRLARIDAPEFTRGPRCATSRAGVLCDDRAATDAKRRLASLIGLGPVRCRVVDAMPGVGGFQGNDRFGRRVARCAVGDRDLGDVLLREGLARPWP